MNKYLLFFGFTDFWQSSRCFSSIVISLNFYHVEYGDGRQPRILVDNFWIPKPKTRVPLPGFTQPNFGGDKIKGHKRKVDTNHLASETRQIWKDLLLLDSSNVHPQYEKKKKSKKEGKFQL